MVLDLLIKNGLLVDGTGAPACQADIAISGGKIVGVGKGADAAKRTIDAADLVLFDPAKVGSMGRPERRYDLPGGAKRMVMRSQGIEYTVVNGAVTWEDGKLTGAAAGEVLRS